MIPQLVVSGLALGSIYALLALSLVLVNKATDVVNFAQGEMAMFGTFICFALLTKVGFPLAIVLVLADGQGLRSTGAAVLPLTKKRLVTDDRRGVAAYRLCKVGRKDRLERPRATSRRGRPLRVANFFLGPLMRSPTTVEEWRRIAYAKSAVRIDLTVHGQHQDGTSVEGHKRRWRRAWTGVRSAYVSRHDTGLGAVLLGAIPEVRSFNDLVATPSLDALAICGPIRSRPDATLL
jgi:hypothetical protein